MADSLVSAARELRDAIKSLTFAEPVACVYNPLDYAWRAHQQYIQRYGAGRKQVLFLGMNPGPFGMVQTGIPFGEVAAVRDWLGISAPIDRPECEHPKRPVLGFDCRRSEVSGHRLWGLFGKRFGTPDKFFRHHFVANYCPLAFVEASGRNRTPDKLPLHERNALFAICDEHLREIVRIARPKWVVGVGDFATKRALAVFGEGLPRIGQILHPSPACPESNVDWAGKVTRQLEKLGAWS